MKSHRRPGAQQATPEPARSTEPSAPAPSHTQSRGNAAAADALSGSDPQAMLAEHAESAAITASGTLPDGLVLGQVDGNTFQTDGDTRMTVGVARWGAWVDLHPPLYIEPGSVLQRLATGGVTVSRVQISFDSGRASVSLDTGTMGNMLDAVFGIEDDIRQAFEGAIQGALPSELVGFDPFTDPDITGRVQKIIQGFSAGLGSKGGAGPDADALAAQVSDPSVGVSISPEPATFDLGEKMNLDVGERAWFQVSADMAGSLADAMEAPQVEGLNISARDLTIEHETAGALAAISIRSARLGPDLSVERFDYDLSTEGILGGLKALAMLFQLRSGQDLGVRDVNSPRLEALREMIDTQVRETVPELLREQVRANRESIPGLDLAQVLPGAI